MEEPRYDASSYWSDRLTSHFTLRGTGHLGYSERYNAWLYRAKQRALRRALNDIPRSADALDVGSGVGWVVEQLRSRGHRVDGCDISEMAVSRLAEHYPDSAFFVVTLGVTPVPREAGSYDLVTAMDVAYHVTDDEQWTAALTELARVLRPGGHLIVTDRFGDTVREPAPHVRFRTLDMWREHGHRVGLELLDRGVLYRWLSRDRDTTKLARLPDGVHGALAYALDRTTWREPHLQWARFRRSG